MAGTDGVHVVFGAGALGQAVMRELVRRGWQVRMVSRSARLNVPAGVEMMRGDATDPDSTQAVCKDAAVVYQCAAPAYTDWAAGFPPMQSGIIAGAAAAGAVLVYPDNVYMYGLVDGEMTEQTPQLATTRKGAVRRRLTADLLAAHQAGRVRVAVGRAPDYYGPGADETTVYGGRVFYPALAGKTVRVMGKLDVPHTFIYVDDFARGLVTLGEAEKAWGQVWHLPCAPTLTQRRLLTLIFQAAGHPPKMAETPGVIFKGLGLVQPMMRELAEMLYQWEHPYRFNHDAFAAAFGAEVTSHEEAVRTTVDWFRSHPKP